MRLMEGRTYRIKRSVTVLLILAAVCIAIVLGWYLIKLHGKDDSTISKSDDTISIINNENSNHNESREDNTQKDIDLHNIQTNKTDMGTIIQLDSSIALKIDGYLKAYEEKGLFSGSVLIAKKDKIILSKGYGMANYEMEVPNKPSTKFHLGSVTKQFTAMAIMKLQEKGLLDVNDSISKYIPDYPNTSKITIHHLLTHTSGIPDYINDDGNFENICKNYHSINEIIDRFKNKPLEFKPGTKYEYSNSGYLLLSYIIEKVSKKTYEDFLVENIFKPLDMKDTDYDYTKPLVKNRSAGYSISSGKLTNAEFFDRSNLKGADGLYSTVEDLYKWDRALYTEKLVSKVTLKKIFTPYPPGKKYGYGWTTDNIKMSHFGRMDGFYNYIGRNTEEDSVVIVLCNIQQAPINVISKDLNSILAGKEYKISDELGTVKVDFK